MAGVSSSAIVDLVNGTLDDIERQSVTQTYTFHNYGMSDFFFGSKPESKTGKQLQFDIRLRSQQNARFVTMYESTPNNQQDLTTKGYEPWRHIESKIHWDEKEIAMNSGDPEQIFDILQERYNGGVQDNYDLIERNIAFAPLNSTSERSLRGLLYHLRTLPLNTSDDTGGFNGITVIYGDGTTETNWCTLDRNVADNANIRNYVGTIAGTVDEGLFNSLRRAMNRTNFRGLPGIKDKYNADAAALIWDSNYQEEYEAVVNRRQVEGKSGDVNGITKTSFRNCEFIEAPALNATAFRPIFGVRRKALQAFLLADRWMKKGQSINDRDQVESYTVPIVSSMALRCRNPRAGFVLHLRRTS